MNKQRQKVASAGIFILISLIALTSTLRSEDVKSFFKRATDTMLSAVFGGDAGIKAAGIDKLNDAQRAILIRQYNFLLRDSDLGNSALRYLESNGWERFQYSAIMQNGRKYLVVNKMLETWYTECPITFTGTGGQLLGKGALLSGPTEIIFEAGHLDLIFPEWKRASK